MTKVYIAGIGQTKVGELWDRSLRNLSAEAILKTLKDAGKPQVDALYVGNLLASVASNQANLGAMIAPNAGLNGVEAITAEAGEASGAAAVRMGYLAVKSGYVRTVLVVGVEKYTDTTGSASINAVAQTMDYDFETMQGLTPAAQAGMLMARYMNTYHPTRSALGALPILAHTNAVSNPNAMYHKRITEKIYEKAGLANDSMNLFDAAPYADGAAAVLLTSDERIFQISKKPVVEIEASSSAIDALALHDRPDPITFSAVTVSTQKALAAAKIEWEEIDLFELWDAYSIYGVLSVEACGLAERGEGWRWLAENDHSLKSALPLVTMGGNKARGYPLGAAGVYQVVEATLQLRGEAGENQVPGARIALVQAMGGPAANVITHIFSRK
ncbi:MAG: thiolase domain-containing protein [Anaerolineaceae bacterium]|nr:thiolase domain-containing protein [Anaerolineaceae bacterium]